MPIGGQRLNVRLAHVHRKCAQALDRVDKEEAAVPAADFPDGIEVRAITAQILHEADSQQTGAANGAVDFLQRREHAEPFDLNAVILQTLPREIVGGEFLAKGHDAVAGPPFDAACDGGNPLGGVLYERDLGRCRVDKARGGRAQSVVGFHPLVVMVRAVEQAIVSQVVDGFGGASAKRRHTGMMQINQVFGCGKVVAVLAPHGRFILETHQSNYTLNQ